MTVFIPENTDAGILSVSFSGEELLRTAADSQIIGKPDFSVTAEEAVKLAESVEKYERATPAEKRWLKTFSVFFRESGGFRQNMPGKSL